MDDVSSAQTAIFDGEFGLLLFELRRAHSILDRCVTTCEQPVRARYLQQAIENYGSVKGLLPKVGLAPAQITALRDQLDVVRSRLSESDVQH